jgi:acetyltransferase
MDLDTILEYYPKKLSLKGDFKCQLRPLKPEDEQALHQFMLRAPETERLFIKHRVTDSEVIHNWCQNIDYSRNLPLLAWADDRVIADATLHQQCGGWKRHIGRISVLVDPEYRGRGVARSMVSELIEVAPHIGLEKIEAEFIGNQEKAIQMFAVLGFTNLLRLPDYVKDMQAISHDYVLMGLDLTTDEEYAGMG